MRVEAADDLFQILLFADEWARCGSVAIIKNALESSAFLYRLRFLLSGASGKPGAVHSELLR
jgi:hypothetical protein